MKWGRFRRQGDEYVAVIDGGAALVISSLCGQTYVLLDPPLEGTEILHSLMVDEVRELPDDPILQRMLPPMSSDPDEAAVLRALTEDALRREKSDRLETVYWRVVEAVTTEENEPQVHDGEVRVSQDEVWDWLAALNDVRMMLSQQLGINDDRDADRVARRAQQFFQEYDIGDADPESGQGPRWEDEECAVFALFSWWQDSLLQAVRVGSESY